MPRDIYFRSDIAHILAALYKPGDDRWNEVLIRVGYAFGMSPGTWIPAIYLPSLTIEQLREVHQYLADKYGISLDEEA